MTRSSRIAGGAAVALALAGATVAAPASGAGTTRTVVADFSEPYGFAVACAQFGDYAFDLTVQGEQQVRITTVTSAGGTLLRTVTHSSFSETDTNSISGASLPLAGTMNDIVDHEGGTRTVRGDIARGTQPGQGTYFKESGQIVFDGGVGSVVFAAGRHDAIAFGGINASLCAALAEA